MSTDTDEKDFIIEDAANSMYLEILLTGYMTADELLERLAELIRDR